MSEKFITEQELREKHSLTWGTEIHLPFNTKLTPSASQYLSERKITVKYIDEQGKVFIKDIKKESAEEKKVHPLTTSDQKPDELYCGLCNNKIDKKSDVLTWLDSNNLVPKNHPRIVFRGKLDTMISYCVLLQTEFQSFNGPEIIKKYLEDLRSYMGNILRSEVKNAEVSPFFMGEFDSEAIHKMSHNPLKYMGYDHIVPEVSYGKWVAMINYLRAIVREAELSAANIFIDASLKISRPDILHSLNRLSSALYVLMIMIVISEKGKDLNSIAKDVK